MSVGCETPPRWTRYFSRYTASTRHSVAARAKNLCGGVSGEDGGGGRRGHGHGETVQGDVGARAVGGELLEGVPCLVFKMDVLADALGRV